MRRGPPGKTTPRNTQPFQSPEGSVHRTWKLVTLTFGSFFFFWLLLFFQHPSLYPGGSLGSQVLNLFPGCDPFPMLIHNDM